MAKTVRVEGVSEAVDQMMKAEAWMVITVTRTDDGSHVFDLCNSNPIAMHALIAYADAYADEWISGTTEDDDL